MAEKLYSIENIGDVSIVRLRFDEISREDRERIKEVLNAQVKNDIKKFIIDLSKVGFISSLLLALILFFSKEIKQCEGLLKVSGLNKEAMSIFQLTNLDRVLDLYETEESALKSFE